MLGKTILQTASHYDDPSVDPFNRGTFTSNGERFLATDPTRTASAIFPDGTELLLRNPQNNRVSHVRVNDFGPFWGNRELDVTRRVAEDLGFAQKGVTELEVTIVASPREDDVRHSYRRDRTPIPTLGHLGVRSEEETSKLAKILLQRLPVALQKTVFANNLEKSDNVPVFIKRETIFHYIHQQSPSPRAAGAEAFGEEQKKRAQQALQAWRAARLARRDKRFYTFAWVSVFLTLALVGPVIIAGICYFYFRINRRHPPKSHFNYNTLERVFNRKAASRDLLTNRRVAMVVRRKMIKLHNLTFSESYAWPHVPIKHGSARPPADRTELAFDIDYVWPNMEAQSDKPIEHDQLYTTQSSLSLLLASITDVSAPEVSDIVNDDINIKDQLADLPAHERLKVRLGHIRQTFEHLA